MRLYEEYFKRHNIDIPLVDYCSQGCIILRGLDRAFWDARWILVIIEWSDHLHHPGMFRIDFYVPVHNGTRKSPKLFNRLPGSVKEWDEYEDFILNWTSKLKGVVPVRGEKEVLLATWEMFVYCYDDWFRRQSHELKDFLFKTLDEDLSVDERYLSYQEFMVYFSVRYPGLMKVWKQEMLPMVQNYSDWLVRLIQERCSTLQLK